MHYTLHKCQDPHDYFPPWEVGTTYNGLYREAPPKRGTFFSLQVYEWVGISLVELYQRAGKSAIAVCEKDLKELADIFYGCGKDKKTSRLSN